jgi:hypothetical protein
MDPPEGPPKSALVRGNAPFANNASVPGGKGNSRINRG